MFTALFVAVLVIGVVACELVRMWWHQNAWRRRWRDRDAND